MSLSAPVRFVPWRAAVAAALWLTAITPPLAHGDDTAPVTTALYLQHVGLSDKPIFPVVICEARSADTELAQVLGTGPGQRLVTIVPVTKPDLQKFLRGVTRELAIAKEPGELRPLGTFKIILTQAKTDPSRLLPANTERVERTVAPEFMPGILAVFEGTPAYTAPDSKLKNALATLKARTTSKEAK